MLVSALYRKLQNTRVIKTVRKEIIIFCGSFLLCEYVAPTVFPFNSLMLKPINAAPNTHHKIEIAILSIDTKDWAWNVIHEAKSTINSFCLSLSQTFKALRATKAIVI